MDGSTEIGPDSYVLPLKMQISCTCTHHVLLLAQSWWCSHRWVPIRQILPRSCHTGYHHWHRNTPQLNPLPKEAHGMNSLLKADDRGRGRVNHQKKNTWQRILTTGVACVSPQLMSLTGGCCSSPRLPAASASPGTEFHAPTSKTQELEQNKGAFKCILNLINIFFSCLTFFVFLKSVSIFLTS